MTFSKVGEVLLGSMSALLALLQESDPSITATMAADLRAGLVAINQQVQAEPASQEWSLNSWWQWLDDEGYERQALLLALQQICVARIGEPALAEIGAACRAMAHEPGGLRLLQDLLEAMDADLPDQLHRLEAQALTEANELSMTAGGMSAAVKGVCITGGVVATGLLLRHIFRRGDAEAAQAGLYMIRHESQVVEGRVIHDLNVVDNNAIDLEHQLRAAILANPESALAKIQFDRAPIYDNLKLISKYTEKDVEHRAAVLTAQHVRAFLLDQDERLILDHIRNSSGYKKKVLEIAAADPAWEGIQAEDKGAILDRARDSVEKGDYNDWFADTVKRLKGTEFGTTLREGAIDKIYNSYKFMISQEVQASKADVASFRDDISVRAVDGEAIIRDDISVTAVYGEAEEEILVCKQAIMEDIVRISEDAKAAASGGRAEIGSL